VVPEEAVKWVKNRMGKGFTIAEVTRSLIKAGYTEEQIDEVLGRATGTWKEKEEPEEPVKETGGGIAPGKGAAKGLDRRLVIAVVVVVLLVFLSVIGVTAFFVYEWFLRPPAVEVPTPVLDKIMKENLANCTEYESELLRQGCFIGMIHRGENEEECTVIPAEWETSFYSSAEGKVVSVNLRKICVNTKAFTEGEGPDFLKKFDEKVKASLEGGVE